MLGVKDYCPKFYSATKDFINGNAIKLKSLFSKQITKIYTVHDLEDNELWKDCRLSL